MAAFVRLASLLVVAVLHVAPGRAANLAFDVDFNLARQGFSTCDSLSMPGWQCNVEGNFFFTAPPVNVHVGDRVEIAFRFQPGQSIQMIGNPQQEAFQVFFVGHTTPGQQPGQIGLSNVSFELLALRGSLLKPFAPDPGFTGCSGRRSSTTTWPAAS